MKILLIVALVALFSQAVRAEEEVDLLGLGAGSYTCAKYGKMYQENPELVEGIFTSWAQGYMTGKNVLWLQAKLPIRNLKTFSIKEVNTICSREPLKEFWIVVEKVYNDLPASKTPERANSN